jgi:hypothetical protein
MSLTSEIHSTSASRSKPLFMSKLSYPGFPDNWDSLKLPEFTGFIIFVKFTGLVEICNFRETYEFTKFP